LYLAREFSQIQIVFLFFGDISDPVPLLELTIGLQTKAARMQDVDLEVKQLRETLAEYNEEFRQVRNQGKKNQHFLFLFFFLALYYLNFFMGMLIVFVRSIVIERTTTKLNSLTPNKIGKIFFLYFVYFSLRRHPAVAADDFFSSLLISFYDYLLCTSNRRKGNGNIQVFFIYLI
jgi:hypothetical protein